MTGFVFGNTFQEYIPLLVYSIIKAYPDYKLLIFVRGNLQKHISKQLEILNPLGSFTIKENFHTKTNLRNQRGKALRWVTWVEEFHKYHSIYYSDIDMFYIKEEPGLYEQHMTHCKLIGKPFSNIQRSARTINPYRIKNFLKSCKHNTFYSTFKRLFQGITTDSRLSGLHFIQTNKYNEKVGPLLNKYYEILIDEKTFKHHLNGFNNESFLYDLVNESGLGVNIPTTSSNKEMFDASPTNTKLRPHHGLHLSIFKDLKNIMHQQEIVDSSVYRKYFKIFFSLQEDPIFKKIQHNFSEEVALLINNINTYYLQGNQLK